jgi:hypothetical protein
VSNLDENYPEDVIEQARQELAAEEYREAVEQVKAVLVSRRARWARYVRFWSLIKSAFRELLA